MMFAIDSSNFSLICLKKIIIYKNNSVCISLNPSFITPIFSSQSSRLDKIFKLENIEKDKRQ